MCRPRQNQTPSPPPISPTRHPAAGSGGRRALASAATCSGSGATSPLLVDPDSARPGMSATAEGAEAWDAASKLACSATCSSSSSSALLVAACWVGRGGVIATCVAGHAAYSATA